eukprot:12427777-Karenia_brevis.AAC.1
MASTRAQGLLEFIAKLVFAESGDTEHATSRSLASLHRAPTRWLSDVAPLEAMLARVVDLVLYCRTLTLEAKAHYRTLGEGYLGTIRDIRFFLVLPGLADMLAIVNDFNVRCQPGATTLDNVARDLHLCLEKLDDICTRTKSE